MSSLDTATTLQATTGFASLAWYLTVNGSMCYAAGNSSRVTAVDLTNPTPPGNTTLLPFTTSELSLIGTFTNDGTWFYTVHGSSVLTLRKIRMTAVGAGGNPANAPAAADYISMGTLSSPAQFGPATVGPDGTLYVAERAASAGPYTIKSVLTTSPYTRTTVATVPKQVTNLSVDATNTIWAIAFDSATFTNYTLYKVAGGTATVWNATAAVITGMTTSGQYVYITRYPTSGSYASPGGSPARAIQVSRFAKSAAGSYVDVCGSSSSFGSAAGAGTAATFTQLRSIIPYGTETLLVHDNGGLRSLSSSTPPPVVPAGGGWAAG